MSIERVCTTSSCPAAVASCQLPTRKCLQGFFSFADFVHCCCLVGTLQGILFISVRGININVFVRPESEQQQRKKQPCHNAILPASSTAFTNRAARDQPAHPPAPSTHSLSPPPAELSRKRLSQVRLHFALRARFFSLAKQFFVAIKI